MERSHLWVPLPFFLSAGFRRCATLADQAEAGAAGRPLPARRRSDPGPRLHRFVWPDLRRELTSRSAVLIGCPRSDDHQSARKRLIDILQIAAPRSLTVVHMEAPCCSWHWQMAREAVAIAGRPIPLWRRVIGPNGRLAEESAGRNPESRPSGCGGIGGSGYWHQLAGLDPASVCRRSGAVRDRRWIQAAGFGRRVPGRAREQGITGTRRTTRILRQFQGTSASSSSIT